MSSNRINFSTGSKWEGVAGYSRAVKKGNVIEISGTVSAGENGQVIAIGDAYEQTRFILQKIEKVLNEAVSSLRDVVRTRMFVTDISRFKEYATAHGEFFLEIKPCTSMIEVKGLVEPEYLIEIEVTAIV